MQKHARIAIAACVTSLVAGPALGQYAPVDPMPMGQTGTSTMANKISGDIASGKSRSNSVSSRCFANSGLALNGARWRPSTSDGR